MVTMIRLIVLFLVFSTGAYAATFDCTLDARCTDTDQCTEVEHHLSFTIRDSVPKGEGDHTPFNSRPEPVRIERAGEKSHALPIGSASDPVFGFSGHPRLHRILLDPDAGAGPWYRYYFTVSNGRARYTIFFHETSLYYLGTCTRR